MSRHGGRTPGEIAARYDLGAKAYSARHDAMGQRKYRRIEASMRVLLKAGSVLDLGSGSGHLLQQVPPKQGVGVDISLQMLKNSPLGLATSCADAHQLPFADESFDAVIAAQGVIRYLDLKRALAEVARVLKPGGHFAAHQFGDVYSFRRWRFTKSNMNLASSDELIAPADASGLATVRVELWRPIRVFPYALKVPSWSPRGIWTHCVAIFEKPNRAPRL